MKKLNRLLKKKEAKFSRTSYYQTSYVLPVSHNPDFCEAQPFCKAVKQ